MSAAAGVAAADSGGGGVGTPSAPLLRDVICLERCAGIREATTGSTVQLSGRDLGSVDEVRFVARGGGRVAVAPTALGASSVETRVPGRAATGTVRASAYGVEAETPADRPLKIVAPGEIPDAGEFRLTSARATPRQSYYDAPRAPQVSYIFQGDSATDVRIEVVNRETEQVVGTMIQKAVAPNASNTVKWDGLGTDGAPAPNGEYKFEIGNAGGGGTEATDESVFGYHLYRFPIDGHHSFGDGYGAGRDHEGQDVFAKCGTPVHAVRGGRVQANATHAAAGNYIVIDGKGTKLDTVYAHMLRRSPLRKGTRVRTGQVIGNVGQSGNASDCHLHFEIWSAPGWYEGGHAMPSVDSLMRTWDRWG